MRQREKLLNPFTFDRLGSDVSITKSNKVHFAFNYFFVAN